MSNIFNDDFLEYIQLLNNYNVEYLLVGGLAVNLHGYKRSTGDMDVWVNPTKENHEKLKKVHLKYGLSMGEMENVNDFLNTKKYDVFTFGGGFYQIDILTECKGLEFFETYKDSLTQIIENVEIRFINLKQLLKAKKTSNRAIDLNDIANLKKSISEEE